MMSLNGKSIGSRFPTYTEEEIESFFDRFEDELERLEDRFERAERRRAILSVVTIILYSFVLGFGIAMSWR